MKPRIINLGPIRFAIVPDMKGEALFFPGGAQFSTNLRADWFNAKGKHMDSIDLGSGLVTNGGADYLSQAMAAVAGFNAAAFNYHDSGTGTTTAAVTDTGLQTTAAMTRALGVQSNPAGRQYRTVASQTFTGTFAITEWALFSALTGGTAFDHRIFAAINVVVNDAIQYTYTLTVNSGG